jgi:hypothetical protein
MRSADRSSFAGAGACCCECLDLAGGAAAPVFSNLRINCTDLDASIAWYSRLGFTAEAVGPDARDGAVLRVAGHRR